MTVRLNLEGSIDAYGLKGTLSKRTMARLSGRSIWLTLAMVTPAARLVSRRLTASALAIASGSADMITSTWSEGENCCQNSGSRSAVDVFMQGPSDRGRHHSFSRDRKQDNASRADAPPPHPGANAMRSPSAVARTRAPSGKRPFRSSSASGFSISCWMARLSGRAP